MKTEPNRNIQRFDSLTSRSLSLQPCRRCRGFLGRSILDFARNDKGRTAHCGELKSLTGGSEDPRPNEEKLFLLGTQCRCNNRFPQKLRIDCVYFLQSSASAASALSSSLAEFEQDKTTLQRVVRNRPSPKPLRGVSDFTAADHLICPPVTQAWDKPGNPRLGGVVEARSKLFSKLRPRESEL